MVMAPTSDENKVETKEEMLVGSNRIHRIVQEIARGFSFNSSTINKYLRFVVRFFVTLRNLSCQSFPSSFYQLSSFSGPGRWLSLIVDNGSTWNVNGRTPKDQIKIIQECLFTNETHDKTIHVSGWLPSKHNDGFMERESDWINGGCNTYVQYIQTPHIWGAFKSIFFLTNRTRSIICHGIMSSKPHSVLIVKGKHGLFPWWRIISVYQNQSNTLLTFHAGQASTMRRRKGMCLVFHSIIIRLP